MAGTTESQRAKKGNFFSNEEERQVCRSFYFTFQFKIIKSKCKSFYCSFQFKSIKCKCKTFTLVFNLKVLKVNVKVCI